MAILFRGTDRITVPDAVAADYEADGWSRSRAGAATDRRDSGTVQADGDAARPPRARRKADR